MRGVLNLTLDTSCVIHGAQQQEQGALADRLVEVAHAGRVRLSLTTAYARDQESNPPERVRINEAWLAGLPVVTEVPGPFRLDYSAVDGPDVLLPGPARWDYSRWDGPDVMVDGGEHADAIVRRIVLPPRLWAENMDQHSVLTDKDAKRFHDVQHLMAHRMSGNDAFVTSDDDDILGNAARLRDEAGIVAWSLAQAVAEVER